MKESKKIGWLKTYLVSSAIWEDRYYEFLILHVKIEESKGLK